MFFYLADEDMFDLVGRQKVDFELGVITPVCGYFKRLYRPELTIFAIILIEGRDDSLGGLAHQIGPGLGIGLPDLDAAVGPDELRIHRVSGRKLILLLLRELILEIHSLRLWNGGGLNELLWALIGVLSVT